MPKRTDISSILVIGAPPPRRGGAGGGGARRRRASQLSDVGCPHPTLPQAGEGFSPRPFREGFAPLPGGEGLGGGERAAGARPGSRASDAPTQPSPERGRASGFGASEGDLFEDADQDAVGVLQYVVVPEADDAIAMRLYQARALLIGGIVGVLPAVALDRQLEAAASEIDDEVADLILARELDAQLAAAQVRPQAFLGIRRFAPQPLRYRRQALARHELDTPTQPSPERGRAIRAIAA